MTLYTGIYAISGRSGQAFQLYHAKGSTTRDEILTYSMKHCKTCTCGEKFKNGVDWRIIGKSCDCVVETLPVADEAGEDIRFTEKMDEFRGKQCEDCKKYFRLAVEEGNMASKRNLEKAQI